MVIHLNAGIGGLSMAAGHPDPAADDKQEHVGRRHHKDIFIISFFAFWRQDAQRKQSPVHTSVELMGRS